MSGEFVEVPLDWSDPEGHPWKVSLRFAAIDGKVQCVGFTIDPVGDIRPVTATLMRSVPVGRLIDEVLRDSSLELVRLAGLPSFNTLATLAEANLSLLRPKPAGDESTPRRGRPRKYGPEHYARVARIYLESASSPTSRVADDFKVPITRAANWVRTARDLGLLDQAEGDEVRSPSVKPRVLKIRKKKSDE